MFDASADKDNLSNVIFLFSSDDREHNKLVQNPPVWCNLDKMKEKQTFHDFTVH